MCKRTAVILAGGKGTRLRPYTLAMPKPLVPVGDKPILEIVLKQLAKEGFSDVNLAVNHQAELIEAYCGDGEKYGLHITYFLEDIPLGTMGPLKNMDNLPENFIVMNGDVLSDISYAAFLEEHEKSRSMFTISSYERKQMVDYGVLNTLNGQLTGFQEKPHLTYEVSMGIYAMNRAVLEYIPKNTFFGFDNLMLKLLGANVPVNTKKHNGYWMDIGRPEDYEQAFNDVESQKFVY
jgi:NDP-sugar pyrophosphorylase family protein